MFSKSYYRDAVIGFKILQYCKQFVNSTLVQSVRVYNDLRGQQTNTAKLNRLSYNVGIWDNSTLV